MRYNFSLLFSTRKTYNPSRPFAHPKTYEKIAPKQKKTFPEFVNYKDEQRIHILYK